MVKIEYKAVGFLGFVSLITVDTVSGTVSGTPFFFLNGVFVNQASSTWTVEDWKQLIDSLLK